ncbi:MAG: trypsin-like peptidase domain-containing protein [Ruminococcus sp.]|nr:trypsin-like peptidase domain-containing protein [Ruminococcus sp.]
MSDFYDDYKRNTDSKNNSGEINNTEAPADSAAQDNTFESAKREVNSAYQEPTAQEAPAEGSYEWNSGSGSGEYRHSYVNGNNRNASHNPNNYDSVYSSSSASSAGYSPYQNAAQHYGAENSGYAQNAAYTQNQQAQSSANQGGIPYNEYSSAPNYGTGYTGNPNSYSQPPQQNQTAQKSAKPKKQKVKKPGKPASRGFIAAMLAVTVLASGALGFGGGYIANKLTSGSSSGGMTINQVTSSGTSASNASSSKAGTTSEIVKKTADSVVEIATEQIVRGSFAQQYVQQGAGSGVIISEDGYIITNYHVIEGAQNIKVTLRDGTTSYNAALIGSDEDNDIALLKIDATGLSAATFGDSSSLAVGDYVVAIGNPLGELGGTVTDGIISALAREVTIENKNMTLLQTNAQISPGNSGGGLFNANGELIGVVNAKDSATEVEGIAFAIPINNVLDIINDLKNYGYVTGKVDLGMQLVDITSKETAFYYGVNETGCYVISVTKGSNADTAGFRTGDLITKVNGTEVSSTDDVNKALTDNKVGDKVVFTVYRSGKTSDISLTLAEYVPSGKLTEQGENQQQDILSDNDIWQRMFGW